MIALWMLYATAIGCLLAAAAAAAEQLAVVRRRPRRWAWFGAVLGLLILPFATPARVPVAPTRAVPMEEEEAYGPTETATNPIDFATIPETQAPPAFRERLALPHFVVPDLARFDRALLLAWGGIAALLFVGYIGAGLYSAEANNERVRRRRRAVGTSRRPVDTTARIVVVVVMSTSGARIEQDKIGRFRRRHGARASPYVITGLTRLDFRPKMPRTFAKRCLNQRNTSTYRRSRPSLRGRLCF
jgi:hypothetical protein